MDKNMEKRVWQRVYGRPPMPPSGAQRRQVGECLRRSRQNLRYYESREHDPVYGDAFRRLAADTREHCKMLERIMGN